MNLKVKLDHRVLILVNKRDSKAQQKEGDDKLTRSNSGSFWVDVKNEPMNFEVLDEFKNRIVLDLNGRYFDFNSEFNGKEANFNTSNVIWIKWGNREKLEYDNESWKHDRIKYDTDRVEIIIDRLAEILSDLGDVSIAKDSPISAYVEFDSYEPSAFGCRSPKKTFFKDSKVLKAICTKLQEETGVTMFEVHPYEKAEKFSSRYVHE